MDLFDQYDKIMKLAPSCRYSSFRNKWHLWEESVTNLLVLANSEKE